ncbi:MAG: translation initiation factor IF-2 [Deltaproteobacteria bacterium]|nr:MAG: translation initiation factor IF-2 [Deltaproteobacteria bacterium]
MSKIRVHELAKKMGIDSKDLIEQLNRAGVEAKSHASVLEDADLHKFEASKSASQAASAAEVKVDERRIGSGLIRRRVSRVATEEPATAPSPAPEPAQQVEAPPQVQQPPVAAPVQASVQAPAPRPVATQAPAPAAVQEPVKKAVVEELSEKPQPPVEKPVAAPVSTAVEQVAAPPAPTEAPAARKEAVYVPPPKEPGTRAKILGRVDLPRTVFEPQRSERSDQRPGGPRPDRPAGAGRPDQRPGGPRPAGPAGAGRPDQRPGGPRPAGPRPAGPRPGGPGFGAAPAPDLSAPGKDVGRGRNVKKKKGRADVVEEKGGAQRRKDRQIYEPDAGERYRKGKKAPRPAQKTEITVSKAIKRKIRITDVISVGELAKRMGVKANDLIKELMRQGQMVTINHPLDFETAALIASDFSYEVENVAFDEESMLAVTGDMTKEEAEGALQTRPPVVTIMGHVDHGKTSLLDAIREANVTAGEFGGITQHIGAYDVTINGKQITFLDTPGHEAFTAMRARGAQVTDIVVLVVAADDGVMPQTREAINHARAAKVPIMVAVNKIDKPEANIDRVRQELTEFGLVSEDWGGETIFVNVSAKKRMNIDQLLEMILLQAEVMDLKANPDKRAQGTVVEARLDKGRGPVATVLVQQGTLKIGDPIVAGVHYGRVRTMTDDRGKPVKEAGPSFPVEVTGLIGVPDAGEMFHAVEDEKVAKDVAQHRAQKQREAELAKTSKISLDQLYARIKQGDVKELRVIVKADVQGSVEAVAESLGKLATDACRLLVIHSGVGAITETDISLAAASDAIVLGFNVRPAPKASAQAEAEGVDIRLYNVIYDAVNDVRSAMEGLLAPTYEEEHLGRAEVREAFNITKVGTIAGCYVLDGKIQRNAKIRLLRDSVVIWQGKLSSLRRFKDDVREVASGYECGIGLENYNDIKPGDVIEAYELREVKATL